MMPEVRGCLTIEFSWRREAVDIGAVLIVQY
jgi:hypothetical protein